MSVNEMTMIALAIHQLQPNTGICIKIAERPEGTVEFAHGTSGHGIQEMIQNGIIGSMGAGKEAVEKKYGHKNFPMVYGKELPEPDEARPGAVGVQQSVEYDQYERKLKAALAVAQSYPIEYRLGTGNNKLSKGGELLSADGCPALTFMAVFYVKPQYRMWSKSDKGKSKNPISWNLQDGYAAPDCKPGMVWIMCPGTMIPEHESRIERMGRTLPEIVAERSSKALFIDGANLDLGVASTVTGGARSGEPGHEIHTEPQARRTPAKQRKIEALRAQQKADGTHAQKEFERRSRKASRELVVVLGLQHRILPFDGVQGMKFVPPEGRAPVTLTAAQRVERAARKDQRRLANRARREAAEAAEAEAADGPSTNEAGRRTPEQSGSDGSLHPLQTMARAAQPMVRLQPAPKRRWRAKHQEDEPEQEEPVRANPEQENVRGRKRRRRGLRTELSIRGAEDDSSDTEEDLKDTYLKGQRHVPTGQIPDAARMVGDAFAMCEQGKGQYASGEQCSHDLVALNGVRGIIEASQDVYIRHIERTVRHYRVLYEDGEFGRYGHTTIQRLRKDVMVTQAYARGARQGEAKQPADEEPATDVLPHTEVRWGKRKLSVSFTTILALSDPQEIEMSDVYELWSDERRAVMETMGDGTVKQPWPEQNKLILAWLRNGLDESTIAEIERLHETAAGAH